MILIDTSVWVDHFRIGNPILLDLLEQEDVLIHPMVMGELALGRLPHPDRILQDLADRPAAATASDEEALQFILQNALSGTGVGYVDAHLLAATRLTPGASLWTRDRRLLTVARRLDLSAEIEPYAGFQEV